MRKGIAGTATVCLAVLAAHAANGDDWWKPYSPPCTERENVFAFAEKPAVKLVGKDRYEITFAVKGYCDVTVGIVDEKGVVVRHLASGVLGSNAPPPFQENALKQTLTWNGKDDLDIYHKHPGKLVARVSLGLKPVFDKRLGGTSAHNLPCGAWAVALDASGAYVFAFNGAGFNHGTVRKFGHDGEYLSTLFPPPASMPLDKLAGMSFIEYGRWRLSPSQLKLAKRRWRLYPVNRFVLTDDWQGKESRRERIVPDGRGGG